MSAVLAGTATSPRHSPWRLFAWSIRRELWHSRAIVFAPFAIGALFIAGAVLAAFNAGELILQLKALDPRRRAEFMFAPTLFAGEMIKLIAVLLAATYTFEAFHGERRDRSILFWKSLPVSDMITVLAKAAVPLLVVPIVACIAIVVTQVVMLAIAGAAFSTHGMSFTTPWTETQFAATLPWTLFSVFAQMLWQAPLYAWLMLVSGWARRLPALWAIGVPIGISIVEGLAFQTAYFGSAVKARLSDGYAATFGNSSRGLSDGAHGVDGLLVFFTAPSLLAGMAIAVVFIVAAMWLRRRAEPI